MSALLEKLLVTIDEAAALVSYSPRTVRNWTYYENTRPPGWPAPAKNVAGCRYRVADLVAWVDGSRELTNPPAPATPPRRGRGRPRKVPALVVETKGGAA